MMVQEMHKIRVYGDSIHGTNYIVGKDIRHTVEHKGPFLRSADFVPENLSKHLDQLYG